MGDQLPCTLHYNGKASSGTALLETSELIFRGEPRLKIPFNSILEARAEGGELRLRTRLGDLIFGLGPKAAAWCEKILHPKSLLAKLGVKPGDLISLFGKFSAEFLADLGKRGARAAKSKMPKDATAIFLAAEAPRDLQRVKPLAHSMQGATALWIVYPKGQKTITESHVRAAGLSSGLTDIKVAAFSPTHTALKFVIPKARR